MTKYIAKHDGKIVGTRSTKGRTYTHAVVVQDIEEVARDRAYNRSAESIAQDRRNFAFYVECATGTYHGTFNDGRKYTSEVTGTELERAQEYASLGVDGYIAEQRQQDIARFETRKAKGEFEPHVATWCGRPDLAQKAVSQFTGPSRRFIAIVPAEEVIKPSNAKLAKALNASGVFAPFTCVGKD